jgi:DNA polymerase (family 10)
MNEIFQQNSIDACITGELRRTEETISSIEFLISDVNNAELKLKEIFGDQIIKSGKTMIINLRKAPEIKIHLTDKKSHSVSLFITTGSSGHVEKVKRHSNIHGYEITEAGLFKNGISCFPETEENLYEMIGLSYIPPETREGIHEIGFAAGEVFPSLINDEDTIGTIHNHTTYSDGKASLIEMAQTAQEMGYKWIGISDHSITAHYAGGMSEKSLQRQHAEIDMLNAKKGIRILKGIECDIQQDGSLDYGYDVLNSFDFVIASIHSHMDMDRASMTQRIIKAIRNPFTTILGHPTGRVLLARRPYEVDMGVVLAEAAGHGVMVELNANPLRLDLDWRLIPGFTSKGGRVVIAPDAHSVSGLDDMRYGLAIARKGLLVRDSCMNVYSAREAREAFKSRWS